MGAIQLMGLSWAFSHLLVFFKPEIEAAWSLGQSCSANVCCSGHKRIMSAADVLGLVLS